MKTFILASASPRRRDILKKLGYNFIIEPSMANEDKDMSLPKELIAQDLAVKKAEEVFKRRGGIVVAADTIVVLDGEILNKPVDKAQNLGFLHRLSGRTHKVVTGYCVIADGERYEGYDVAEVLFKNLSEKEMKDYAESGKGLDKAGGYGIQDEFDPVKEIVGEYDTVVGLPTSKIVKILERIL